jgi:hypothetical protein
MWALVVIVLVSGFTHDAVILESVSIKKLYATEARCKADERLPVFGTPIAPVAICVSIPKEK